MITCPKCGELNGDNLTKCFKCQTDLKGSGMAYRKICTKCQKMYDAKAETCETCYKVLAVYNPDVTPDVRTTNGARWPYILAALLPGIGLIAGIVLAVLGREEGGLMIGLAIVASILWAVLSAFATSSYLFV